MICYNATKSLRVSHKNTVYIIGQSLDKFRTSLEVYDITIQISVFESWVYDASLV